MAVVLHNLDVPLPSRVAIVTVGGCVLVSPVRDCWQLPTRAPRLMSYNIVQGYTSQSVCMSADLRINIPSHLFRFISDMGLLRAEYVS